MTGSLQLNGISDQHLVKILEVKLRNEPYLGFNPQQMQAQQYQQNGKTVSNYNNVVLAWSAEQGLDAVQEILSLLTEKVSAKAAGQ